ncbi:UNVERIFIED_CONTAM: hypothetical protein FKN15_015910 [Acipenser sinensis]
MRQGWGLVGDSSMSNKHQENGIGIQCDLPGRITETPSTEATIASVNIPKVWD